MIRLPDVAPARLAQPSPVSRYEADAEWGGPATLDREAMLRDQALRHGWDLVDDDLAEHRFAAWSREEDARFDEAVATLPAAEAKGFAERAARDVFERAKAFKQTLPERARSAFDDRFAGYEQSLFNRAAIAEDGAQLRAVREHLDASLQTVLIPAAAVAGALAAGDPDKLDRLTAIKAEKDALIDRNPALPPHEKRQRKAASAKAIDTAFAEALPPQEKRDLDPDAAIETVGQRIHRLAAEWQVGGRADNGGLDGGAAADRAPANPEGFGAEAWLDLIIKHRSELAKGRGIVEIQALRADPELAAEMRELGLAEAHRFLTDRGHAATPGSLYLAHVTSPETALRLLEADPDSPAVEVDPAASPARPDLFFAEGDEARPRTVGEVLALAEEAMADAHLFDLRQHADALSSEMQVALSTDAGEAEARAAADAKLAEDEAYRTRIAETGAAIDAGTFGHADLVRAADEGGWIRSEDFAPLFNRLVERHSTNLEYEQAVAKLLDPDYRFDPTSPDDQRVVDLLYERHSGYASTQLTFQQIVDRTGITPTRAPSQSAKVDPSTEIARDPSARIVRETKSDRFIPERHKQFADFRAAVADSGVPNFVAAFGEVRHQLLREGIEEAFGAGAVEKYDDATAWVDEVLSDLGDLVDTYIEEKLQGRSRLERDNWKSLADGAIAAASAIAGSAGGGGKGGGGKRGTRHEKGKQDVEARPLRGLPASAPGDWGDFPVVEVKTTKSHSSDAPKDKNTPEYKALNKPEPNTIYRLDNETIFRTNEAGRVDRHEFILSEKRGRGGADEELEDARSDTQHIGHTQGVASGGPSDRYNRFIQDSNFNQGVYNVLEKYFRHIKAERINVDFIRRRDPASPDPDALYVRYLKDGKWYGLNFNNTPGGR